MLVQNLSSDPADVEMRLKLAQVQKLALESRLLETQLSPSHQRLESLKAIAGASGLVLALAAVVGGLLSIVAWFVDRSLERDQRTQEHLERVVSGLSASSLEQRLTSAASLLYFFGRNTPARNSQIITALVNTIPLEQSTIVRSTILSVFEAMDPAVIGQSGLDDGLSALARNSRVLMKESGLIAGLGKEDIWEKGLTSKHAGGLVSIADAIRIFLLKGGRATDFSGIYLARQDLSGVRLPGASFDASILAATTFNDAKLPGASFASAHLEGAKFVRADLRNAKFTFSRHRRMRRYVSRLVNLRPMGAGIHSSVEMPDFRCADLRGTDFSGHALFGFISNAAAAEIGYYHWPVRFSGANIAGAYIKELKPFSVIKKDDAAVQPTPFAGYGGGEGEMIKGDVEILYYWPDDDAKLDDTLKDFKVTAEGLVKSFEGTNWSGASLPKWLREYLKRESVRTTPLPNETGCSPLAPWER